MRSVETNAVDGSEQTERLLEWDASGVARSYDTSLPREHVRSREFLGDSIHPRGVRHKTRLLRVRAWNSAAHSRFDDAERQHITFVDEHVETAA
jgi:hypothetical protein